MAKDTGGSSCIEQSSIDSIPLLGDPIAAAAAARVSMKKGGGRCIYSPSPMLHCVSFEVCDRRVAGVLRANFTSKMDF